MLGEHNRVNLPAQYLFSRKQGYYHRDAPIKINQISRLPERQIRIVSTARISPLPSFMVLLYVRFAAITFTYKLCRKEPRTTNNVTVVNCYR